MFCLVDHQSEECLS